MTSPSPETDVSWRSLSLEELEREYSPSSCLDGDIGPFIEAYTDRSLDAVAECAELGSEVRTITYGPGPRHAIDVVAPDAAQSSPLVLYIHGGYWQELSKADSFFAAADCVRHDVAYAAVGYTLAPDASLDEIVAECRLAASTIVGHAAALGIDPDRIVLAGSSAGAHLAAMVALDPTTKWRPGAVVLASGVFDLEPLIDTYINDAVGLDLEATKRNSPAAFDLADFPTALVVHGDNETPEFKRQSRAFAEKIRAAGTDVELLEIPGRNHFDVVLDLCTTGSELGERTLNLARGSDA